MKHRLATTSDGSSYFVQRIDFRTRTVHCWGELVAYRNLKTRHGDNIELSLDSVTVQDVDKDQALVKRLFNQAKAKHEGRPVPSPEAAEAEAEAGDIRLFEDIFSIIEQAGGPTLVSDLIGALRDSLDSPAPRPESGRRWRIGGNRIDFEDKLEEMGFITRRRKHAAGIAIYVHHSDFSTVIDGRGNLKEVV